MFAPCSRATWRLVCSCTGAQGSLPGSAGVPRTRTCQHLLRPYRALAGSSHHGTVDPRGDVGKGMEGAMTRLVDTVQQMGLDGEISLLGRWVRLQAAQCLVYVIEVAGGCGYYTWCDAPGERTI